MKILVRLQMLHGRTPPVVDAEGGGTLTSGLLPPARASNTSMPAPLPLWPQSEVSKMVTVLEAAGFVLSLLPMAANGEDNA